MLHSDWKSYWIPCNSWSRSRGLLWIGCLSTFAITMWFSFLQMCFAGSLWIGHFVPLAVLRDKVSGIVSRFGPSSNKIKIPRPTLQHSHTKENANDSQHRAIPPHSHDSCTSKYSIASEYVLLVNPGCTSMELRPFLAILIWLKEAKKQSICYVVS